MPPEAELSAELPKNREQSIGPAGQSNVSGAFAPDASEVVLRRRARRLALLLMTASAIGTIALLYFLWLWIQVLF